MLINLFGLSILVLLTLLLARITIRSSRNHRKLLKWPVFLLSSLMTLIFCLVSIFTGKGLYEFYAPRSIAVPQVTVTGTKDQVSLGEHISGYLCAHCHSTDNQLPLTGGTDIAFRSAVPIGSLIPFNLTPGGPLKDWSDGEIFRAVRTGVDRDGRPLITMSSLAVRYLSDDDITAVIAFLRNQQAVQSTASGGDQPNLLFAFFAGANLIPKLPPVNGVVVSPVKGPTAAYGEYMVNYIGCSDCHGLDLKGGKSGGFTPVGPSLRPAGTWTQGQFIQTMRTGFTPVGHALDQEKMFWKDFARMDDIELTAIHAYLRSLITGQTQKQP